jgi:hypothetical protein
MTEHAFRMDPKSTANPRPGTVRRNDHLWGEITQGFAPLRASH